MKVFVVAFCFFSLCALASAKTEEKFAIDFLLLFIACVILIWYSDKFYGKKISKLKAEIESIKKDNQKYKDQINTLLEQRKFICLFWHVNSLRYDYWKWKVRQLTCDINPLIKEWDTIDYLNFGANSINTFDASKWIENDPLLKKIYTNCVSEDDEIDMERFVKYMQSKTCEEYRRKKTVDDND